MWVSILLLVAIYLGYYMEKNYRAVNQSNTMIAIYCQMLYELMEKHKAKEEDYKKLLISVWEIDSNLLPYQEFNKKWEKICKALQVPIIYDDTRGTCLSEKVLLGIASRMYANRHLFQQYTEQSKKMKKVSEDIMNNPKYNY